MTTSTDDPAPIGNEKQLASQLFGDAWTLLDKAGRTADEDDRLIHLAHASRLHWDNVGTDQHRAVGEWQISRVYCALGRAEPALFHARRAVDYASRDGVEDWALASAQEGLARALAVAGDLDAARAARDDARRLVDAVTDPEDRQVVADDIETLPIP